MGTLSEVVTGGVTAILGENGMLVRDGMDFSPIQYQYAMRVAEGFTRAEHADDVRTRINMLEAQTGTGKTLGYLVPLMLYAAQTGERVAVSTYTRMLQSQILDKDAALSQQWVKEVTGKNLSICRRIGRGNYLSLAGCVDMLHDLEQSADSPASALLVLERMIAWLAAKGPDGRYVNSGVLDDCLADIGEDELPSGILRNKITLRADSAQDEQAPYLRSVAESKSADVLIVNHALLMMHAFRWSQILDDRHGNDRKISVLVADEADRLADAAAAITGANLTLHQMTLLTQEVASLFPGATAAAEAVTALHGVVQAMRVPAQRALAILADDPRSRVLADKVVSANNAVRGLCGKLVKRLEQSKEAPGEDAGNLSKLARFADMANDLAMFTAAMQAHDNTAVLSWSPVREYPSLRIGQPNPGRLLSRLWLVRDQGAKGIDLIDGDEMLPKTDHLKAVLFTSGTLSVPGKALPMAFDDFAQSVGVVRFPRTGQSEPVHRVQLDLYAQYEPLKFGSLSFVLADPRVPNPTMHVDDEALDRKWAADPLWLDYAAHMIEQAWLTGERTLVLTLSHAETQAIAERLRTRPLADMLFVQAQGESLAAARKRYLATEQAILLTPGGWEGLDLRGMVPNLVITHIPFAPMSSADTEILRAHLFAKGMATDKIDSAIRARVIHAARRKLAQGIGRGIRSKTDKVRLWIADPRFPMPDSMMQSLDPVLMDALPRRVQHLMLSCVPMRFRDEVFSDAQLCLRDGGLYRPM